MPYFCLEKIERALNDAGKSVRGARILVVGVSYKAGVGDMRESPALKIIGLLHERGAESRYHDPFVPELADLGLEHSAELGDALEDADLAVIVTAHPGVDHQADRRRRPARPRPARHHAQAAARGARRAALAASPRRPPHCAAARRSRPDEQRHRGRASRRPRRRAWSLSRCRRVTSERVRRTAWDRARQPGAIPRSSRSLTRVRRRPARSAWFVSSPCQKQSGGRDADPPNCVRLLPETGSNPTQFAPRTTPGARGWAHSLPSMRQETPRSAAGARGRCPCEAAARPLPRSLAAQRRNGPRGRGPRSAASEGP